MNYTTYYRKDVWERFKDEEDKAALVNRLLEEHYGAGGFSEVPVESPNEPIFTPAVPLKAEVFVTRPPDPVTGYPCCLGKRPCKHWQWDGNNSSYTNILTGEIKDAKS